MALTHKLYLGLESVELYTTDSRFESCDIPDIPDAMNGAHTSAFWVKGEVVLCGLSKEISNEGEMEQRNADERICFTLDTSSGPTMKWRPLQNLTFGGVRSAAHLLDHDIMMFGEYVAGNGLVDATSKMHGFNAMVGDGPALVALNGNLTILGGDDGGALEQLTDQGVITLASRLRESGRKHPSVVSVPRSICGSSRGTPKSEIGPLP